MHYFVRHSFLLSYVIIFLYLGQMSSSNDATSAQTSGRKFFPPIFEQGLTAIRSAETTTTISLVEMSLARTEILSRYGRVIKRQARLYGLDWRLILAVIKQESEFQPDAVSYAGARGLMQIMPGTELSLASELGVKDLSAPPENIQGGALYLSRLYKLFEDASSEDRLCLALAAYNAGPGRIYDAQEVAVYLGEDPNSWNSIQRMLPLLSKCHYTLHQSIWPSGKPPCGYFGRSEQTLGYVRNVITNYTGFKTEMLGG